ncbi:MAG: hypothetical protein JWQ02_1773, partial [Capsulimonas sp.]|nr:hypothetical protein [Capsulimonas sp.]
MVSRKSRLAIAYTSSIVLNGAFWLVYSHELRSGNAHPAVSNETVERMKPMTVGLFKPLPPLPTPHPAQAPSNSGLRPSEMGAAGASPTLRQAEAKRDAAERVLAQKQAAANAAQARAAGLASQSQESQRAAATATTNVQSAQQFVQQAQLMMRTSQQKLAAARAALAQAAPASHAAMSAAVQAAAKRAASDAAQAQSANEVLAQAQTTADTARKVASSREAAAQAAQSKAASMQAEVAKAQDRLNARIAAVQQIRPQNGIKMASLPAADSDINSKTDSEEAAAPDRASLEPQKKEKPQSNIVLQRIQMWSPKAGQKFNLATNLNITFPKDMQVTPGPALTEDQVAQLQELMRNQHLHTVKMDRRQVRKLADMRRKSTSKPKPKKMAKSDSEDERRRQQTKRAKPRPPIRKTIKPQGVMASNLPRPRSPFVVKTWDKDMYDRWAPRQSDNSGMPENTASPQAGAGQAGAGQAGAGQAGAGQAGAGQA